MPGPRENPSQTAILGSRAAGGWGSQREDAQHTGTFCWAAVFKQQPDGCKQKTSQGSGGSSVIKVIGNRGKTSSFLAEIWVILSFHQPVLKEQLWLPRTCCTDFFFFHRHHKVMDSESVRLCTACVLIYGFSWWRKQYCMYRLFGDQKKL